MKISRRNFCLLMAGVCCTGVLAACGSSSSSTASSSAASASAAASGEVRDELIFVNYRDIRDLNPPSVCRRNVCPEHPLRYIGQHYGRWL